MNNPGCVAIGAVALAALVSACAVKTRIGLPDPSHPASPEAPEAVVPEPAGVLREPGIAGGVREATPEGPGHGMKHGGGGTTHSGNRGMGVGEPEKPRPEASHED